MDNLINGDRENRQLRNSLFSFYINSYPPFRKPSDIVTFVDFSLIP